MLAEQKLSQLKKVEHMEKITRFTAVVEDKETRKCFKLVSSKEKGYSKKEFKRDLEQSYIIHAFYTVSI